MSAGSDPAAEPELKGAQPRNGKMLATGLAPSIVLVEDDGPLRTLTARALREHGYDVRPAATGAEMWVLLESAPADLVVLDIMLPGTSGIDLFRKLRRLSDVPIIFISARGSEEDRVLGLELGADDYLAKPLARANWSRGWAPCCGAADRAAKRLAAPSRANARARSASRAGRSRWPGANFMRPAGSWSI
jgi:CheY-like chemotaxis protein